MITRITFADFGKFKGVSFDLAPVTVVYGPNEAGKTTFFDGLFQALCDPSETKKPGKLLKTRYGAHRQATATLVNGAPISEDEFLNLFAIRAGDLRLELSQGSDWMEKLKSGLFHGGLDPKLLADEYERRSSDKRTFVHNKELDAVRERLAKAKLELESRRRERESLLVKEKSLGDLEASLLATRKLREADEEKLRGFDRELAFEDRIALRQKLAAQLARLEDWESLEKGIAELSAFKDARREDWERLAEAVKTAATTVQSERGKRELQADLVAKARTENRSLKLAQESAGPRSQAAAKLADAVRAALWKQGQQEKGLPAWPGAKASAASVVSIGLGGMALLWLRGPGGFAVAALSLGLAVISILAGRRQGRRLAREGLTQALARWKDEWRLVSSTPSGTQPGTPSGTQTDFASIAGIATPEGFLQAMETCAREKENLERQEQESAQRMHELEAALERLDRVLADGRNGEEEARRAEKQWLSALGVASGESFLLKVSRLADIQSQLPKRKSDLETLLQGAEPSGFSRELNRKLQALDEEGIPARGRDEAALQRLRRERQQMQTHLEILAQDEREKIAQTKVLAGEVGATLGKLASEIVKWEDLIAEAEAEVEAKELDKRAAALALEIFRSIGDGTDLLWSGLGQEMETMLGHILPGSRGLTLQGLGTGQLQVQDAAGMVRPLENLSTGTKDAVVLAAKLALALKSRSARSQVESGRIESGRRTESGSTPSGILVLDEPFLAMDQERETRALELLRNFQDRHGWQIILLTKEIPLRDKVLRLFLNPLVVDLTALRGP